MRTVVFVVWPAFRNASGNNWTEAKKKRTNMRRTQLATTHLFFFFSPSSFPFFLAGQESGNGRTGVEAFISIVTAGRAKTFDAMQCCLWSGERDLFYFTTPFAVRLDVEFPSGADGHGLTWRNYRAEREKRGTGPFRPERPITSPRKKKKRVAKVVGERERESYLVIRFAVGPLAHSNFTLCASCRYFHNRESSLAPRNVGKTSRHLYSRIKIKCLTVGGRPSLCNQKKKMCAGHGCYKFCVCPRVSFLPVAGKY